MRQPDCLLAGLHVGDRVCYVEKPTLEGKIVLQNADRTLWYVHWDGQANPHWYLERRLQKI
jgi:hypothetical protein